MGTVTSQSRRLPPSDSDLPGNLSVNKMGCQCRRQVLCRCPYKENHSFFLSVFCPCFIRG